MSDPKRRTTRSLVTAAAAVALAALPLGPIAYSLDGVPVVGAEVVPVEDGDELTTVIEDVVTPLAGSSDGESAAESPAATDSRMEPAGSSYTPVEEPRPAPAPAVAAAPAAEPAAASTPAPHLDRGWLARTMMAFEPVQAPLFAGPLMVPAPQFAEASSVAALARTLDGWAAAPGFPGSGRAAASAPAQWPLPLAVGLVFLVGLGATVYAYDRRWQKVPFSTTL